MFIIILFINYSYKIKLKKHGTIYLTLRPSDHLATPTATLPLCESRGRVPVPDDEQAGQGVP